MPPLYTFGRPPRQQADLGRARLRYAARVPIQPVQEGQSPTDGQAEIKQAAERRQTRDPCEAEKEGKRERERER